MRKLNPIRAASKLRKPSSGFSLIELLIVVAIILVIAAIAIPNLIRARIAANQAAAVENCRTITSAEIIYYTSYGAGFAPSLTALGGPVTGTPTVTNAQLIDDVLSTGNRSGYVFTYVPLSIDASGAYQDYSLNADPQAVALSGNNHYFTDEPSIIHVNQIAPAGINDPPIQ
ncbi:MAG TPA: prepilin-type N-terminal cleavage/methylation domain-containing protein [Candidatus Acidoferrales bacterium]|nr:prepilin-type N-terminal cleavage/methylation domain-containing protein [Candidatus Acidoferrales bacterium]